jgi:hypothetical protein
MDDDDYFEAPTQSLLQKWLREKKTEMLEQSVPLTCHFPYVEKYRWYPNGKYYFKVAITKHTRMF